ncbi:MAG: response regulator [Desulfobacterales bacterium]|nr:response regulator [Desulfobacterales bacterium]
MVADKDHSILVVDDERDMVEALYDAFIDKYEVYTANSAQEALSILKERHIDLVVSDQRMPDTTGAELFDEEEGKYPNMGKVLLTGYPDIQAVIDAINKGAVDKYIAEPWEEDDVIHIVLEVLNARLKKVLEQRKQVQAQLVQNAKMAALGELVAGIAHEINNPLGFIHANLGNLNKFSKRLIGLIESYDRMNFPDETKQEIEKRKEEINYSYLRSRMPEMIERSVVGAGRMKRIVLDLKSFSRLDAAEFAEADLNDAIESTLNIMCHEYKNRIEIIKEYGNIPLIKCYIAKLNQVFMNLLTNACHSIEDKGEIRIRTSMEDEMVKIEISDTGEGIPEDVMDKIFDPFFTTKPVGQGTGFGLSVSHGIVEQHNGEISVKSKPGEGATFTIKIPMHLKSEDLEPQ